MAHTDAPTTILTEAGATAPAADDVEEPQELLIEEISIDGMCGVY